MTDWPQGLEGERGFIYLLPAGTMGKQLSQVRLTVKGPYPISEYASEPYHVQTFLNAVRGETVAVCPVFKQLTTRVVTDGACVITIYPDKNKCVYSYLRKQVRGKNTWTSPSGDIYTIESPICEPIPPWLKKL